MKNVYSFHENILEYAILSYIALTFCLKKIGFLFLHPKSQTCLSQRVLIFPQNRSLSIGNLTIMLTKHLAKHWHVIGILIYIL